MPTAQAQAEAGTLVHNARLLGRAGDPTLLQATEGDFPHHPGQETLQRSVLAEKADCVIGQSPQRTRLGHVAADPGRERVALEGLR